MDNGDQCLPFKVAQEAESKCFLEGFRSAWFRCKIKDIARRKGVLRLRLEYFDYPDEKIRWLNLYQRPPFPIHPFGLPNKMELMLRPCYPPLYAENALPDQLPESDVVVIVNNTWKVGDLIDWCYEGCFWSGKITQILDNGEVQIKLPDPPVGEGLFYVAHCKDLRPSLDWSLENGWTVPQSGDLGTSWHCARLCWPYEEAAQTSSVEMEDGINDTDSTLRKNLISVRSSSTLESSIMALEEITCKIRWLKGLLKFGFQWSDLMVPSWKFLETCEGHLRR